MIIKLWTRHCNFGWHYSVRHISLIVGQYDFSTFYGKWCLYFKIGQRYPGYININSKELVFGIDEDGIDMWY